MADLRRKQRIARDPSVAYSTLSDPARLHLLAETDLVEASAVARLPTLDRLARLAGHATRAAIAQVNLITDRSQVPAAAYVDESRPGPNGAALSVVDAELNGAWRSPVGLEASYCKHVVESGTPLVIADASSDPLVRDNRSTTDGGIRAYAAVPLTTPNGAVLGSVCVVDFQQREWTEQDLSVLRDCAQLAGDEIAARLGASQALRENEQRLRLATEAAHLGSWSYDLRRQQLNATPLCLEHHALPEGASWDDLLATMHVEDRGPFEEWLSSAAAEEDFESEYRVTVNGAERWIAAHAHVICDSERSPYRVVGLTQDITERKLAERHREELLGAERTARGEAESHRQTAETASRAKSEFLAVMSHELRTPLNAIGGYAELMELGLRGPITDQQREDLGRIRASQRQLLGLINEVLNYTKLETGVVRYDITTVSVRAVLDEAEAVLRPQIDAKGLTLTEMQCGPELSVLADRDKLRQVMTNLLSNAVKFTERGGTITLSCTAEHDRVAMHVSDTGIGIPRDRMEMIFEPFVQVRSDFTRIADGIGLGLAISRDLARGMGGELDVESVAGKGSTFTVRLPAA